MRSRSRVADKRGLWLADEACLRFVWRPECLGELAQQLWSLLGPGCPEDEAVGAHKGNVAGSAEPGCQRSLLIT